MCSLTFTLHLTVPNQRWGGVDCPEKQKNKNKNKQTNKQTKAKNKEQLLMIALLNCFLD